MSTKVGRIRSEQHAAAMADAPPPVPAVPEAAPAVNVKLQSKAAHLRLACGELINLVGAHDVPQVQLNHAEDGVLEAAAWLIDEYNAQRTGAANAEAKETQGEQQP